MRGGDSPLEEVNLLELAPLRLASWTEKDDRVVLERPLPSAKGLRRFLEWFQFYSAVRVIRLDELGSYAWKRLDGKMTVGEVARQMHEDYRDSAEPFEERLGQFVRAMRREGLLAYPGWDEASSEVQG